MSKNKIQAVKQQKVPVPENLPPENPIYEKRNIFLLCWLALLAALQVLIVVASVLKFFPLSNEMANLYYGANRLEVQPEREMLLYRLFVMSAIGFQAVGLYVFRHRLKDPEFFSKLLRFALFETTIVFLLLWCLFNMALFESPKSLTYIFSFLLSVTVLVKIFWREIENSLPIFNARLSDWRLTPVSQGVTDILMCLLAILVLYIPDHAGAVAKIFVIDQFWHIDPFFIAPGWAYIKGNLPNVDVMSQYGTTAPVLMVFLTKMFGGLTYENVFACMVNLSILYIILCYCLLRIWMKHVAIAAFGLLLIIKLVIFGHVHPVDYFIWRTPSMTPMRYLFDVFFLVFILFHIRYALKRYLILAGFFVGVSIAYITDTGVYQLIAFYAYLGMQVILPREESERFKPGHLFFWGTMFVWPLLVQGGFLWWVLGENLWQSSYWANVASYTKQTLHGYGAVPIYYNLKEKFFWAFFLGCGIFLTYILTFLRVGSLLLLKKIEREHLFVVVLSVYGLSLFHYFVNRSIATTYFAMSVPFVLIVCYWIKMVLDRLTPLLRKQMLLGMLFGLGFFLLTAPSYLIYPNVLNISRISYDEEKTLMTYASVKNEDVDLIRRLTKPEEKVCLISSYEISLLMAADRRPLFFIFNLVSPMPMHVLQFAGIRAGNKDFFDKTFAQLQANESDYVFIEKKVFERQIPQENFHHYELMEPMVNYLHDHYTPVREGFYLVALKKKTETGK